MELMVSLKDLSRLGEFPGVRVSREACRMASPRRSAMRRMCFPRWRS